MVRFRVRIIVRFKTKHSVTGSIMLMPYANARTGGRNVEMHPGLVTRALAGTHGL